MNLKKKLKTPLSNLEKVSLFISSGALIGFIPPFPGTLGALQGILLYWLLQDLSFFLHLIIVILFTLLGIYTSQMASFVLQKKDPDEVVIDEILGAYLASWGKSGFLELTLAFIFFRIIDIMKPFPLRRLERLPGGFGIMADDILAGLCTNLLVTLIIIWFRG